MRQPASLLQTLAQTLLVPKDSGKCILEWLPGRRAVLEEKTSEGHEIWEEESKLQINVPVKGGVQCGRLQPFSSYTSRSPSTLRNSISYKIPE